MSSTIQLVANLDAFSDFVRADTKRPVTWAFPSAIELLSFNEIGDGGGGLFLWEENKMDPEYELPPENKPLELATYGIRNVGTTETIIRTGWYRRQIADLISVRWFGAKGDMKGVVEGYKDRFRVKGYESGTRKLTISFDSHGHKKTGFHSNDKGKKLIIWENQPSRQVFVTSIEKVEPDSDTVVYTTEPIPSTLTSSAYVAWGTDDSPAIQNALLAAKNTGLAVYLPQGHFLISKTLEFFTHQDPGERDNDSLIGSTLTYMHPGLRMYGAGVQASFLHNEIGYDDGVNPGRPALSIDGGRDGAKRAAISQQNGLLRDFHITSTGQVEDTVGIRIRATWNYQIQNVGVSYMGSDGIVIQNRDYDPVRKNTDTDANENLHINNVTAFNNLGWGITIDAGENGISTGRIQIERCWIEQNKKGGIQWDGQQGDIERCNILANGVTPASSSGPLTPKAINGAYGILAKFVKPIPNGLRITGCQIQGNGKVQVMIATGANIRVSGNDFKSDDDSYLYSFPETDIQVGDGNLGFEFQEHLDKKFRIDLTKGDSILEREILDDHKIIEFTGSLDKEALVTLPANLDGGPWLFINNTNNTIGGGTPYNITLKHGSGAITLSANSESPVNFDGTTLYRLESKTVNACIIEDNRIRVSWTGSTPAALEREKLPRRITEEPNPTPKINFWGTSIVMPLHTFVKINTNAIGTIVGRNWNQSLPEDGKRYRLVRLVDRSPYTGKKYTVIIKGGYGHLNSDVHMDGVRGGHVLFPFASQTFDIQRPAPGAETFTPDTSRWSSFRLNMKGNIISLSLSNPTAHSVGALLFLEFTNFQQYPVWVAFASPAEFGYDVGDGFLLHKGETISGILMFTDRFRWKLFTPWARSGSPPSG